MGRSTTQVTTRIFREFPHIRHFITWLPNLDIPARKAILTICRTQSNLHGASRTRDRLGDQLNRTFTCCIDNEVQTLSLLHLLLPLTRLTTSSYLSGLVSMLTRIIPFDKQELRESFRMAYEFVVYDTCPDWLFDLLSSSFHTTDYTVYSLDSDDDMEL